MTDMAGFDPALKEIQCKIPKLVRRPVSVLISLQSVGNKMGYLRFDHGGRFEVYDHLIEVILRRRYLSEDKWTMINGQQWRASCRVMNQVMANEIPLGAFGPVIDKIKEHCVYGLWMKASGVSSAKFFNTKLSAVIFS